MGMVNAGGVLQVNFDSGIPIWFGCSDKLCNKIKNKFEIKIENENNQMTE